MIDYFDQLYTSIVNKHRILVRIRYYSFLRVIIRLVANVIAPIVFFTTRNNIKYTLEPCKKHEGRIIVSLTSFPQRIKKVWLVIETILRQTKKPDKIILWLSMEQFSSINVLPSLLLKQQERGLEIRLMKNDIRSHKKYYYTLQEYPNDFILTIDDDIFYRTKMIEDMFNYSLRYPKVVISQYSKRMKWVDGELESYSLWPTIKEETTPNLYSFFGSGGGTLFPPFAFDKDVLRKDLFMFLTPTADDIWLNAMCRLNKTKIVSTNYWTNNLPILNIFDVKLHFINLELNNNNIQLQALKQYYSTNKDTDPFFELI